MKQPNSDQRGGSGRAANGIRPQGRDGALPFLRSALLAIFAAFSSSSGAYGVARQPSKTERQSQNPRVETRSAPKSASPVVNPQEEAPLSGDWAPELLDAILSSANPEASDALYRAAFASGRAIVPQLKEALKDDRTAEFAAQSLAFIGGEEALGILSKLVDDSRDLELRRFYYGALAEIDTPESSKILLDVIAHADAEPDRTVSQAAILALSVRSDSSLIPKLRALGKKIKDVVILDDLDSAIAVIEGRSHYLASGEGNKKDSSPEAAIRTYFAPALMPRPAGVSTGSTERRPPSATQGVKVDSRNIVLSPDKTRALARVSFEDATASVQYDLVLQRRDGTWRVAGAWLGEEAEKPEPKTQPRLPSKKDCRDP